ncbi:FtsW/RodA/SpoVE family cell cycle protein [Streptococcus sp. zg-JUN1979]|uniref:FtsW/RodA/SpoVE family cell cycle protein n=1 Tax=Streptococcus sp. zg-JUN1979 TaxID=3391450 RepID=UPI0039A40804
MKKYQRLFKQTIDYGLLVPVFFLVVIGLLVIYIATANDYPKLVTSVMVQQIVWVLLGLSLAYLVMMFKTSFLWKVTPYLYILGLLLMVLPLFLYSPALVASTGAKNWVTISNTPLFQPSEFMKISYILALARVAVWWRPKLMASETLKEDWLCLFYYGLVTLPVMMLLALQKDLGTAMVFMAILAGVILMSGISRKILLPVIVTLVAIVAIFLIVFLMPGGKEFLFKMGMDTYQINRLSAWLDPFKYSAGIAYQQTQGMISIGSGGAIGKGFNVLDLAVPVRESDMIFTVIAEDFGFLGSSMVLLLYLLLIYRMLLITLKSNNQFYTFISTGFIMMISFHIFENIGAALGLLPLTGIPLPFISKGGSSLITNLIGVGLVLSMSNQNYYYQKKH